MSSLRSLIAVSLILSLAACASIIRGPTQDIAVNSTPSEATVTVTDEDGAQVFSGTTPSTVTLNKKKGFFKGKSYTVKIAKAGFEPVNVAITPTAGGWYLGGNILIGGLIGWFIIDPATGSMWTLTPKEISQQMSAQTSMNSHEISIYLLAEVPEDKRADMVRVN